MSDEEVTYEFVKGEGWVPKKKFKAVPGAYIIEDYLQFQPAPDDDNFWGLDLQYRPYVRRPPIRPTLQHFDGLVRRERRTDGTDVFNYTLRTGEVLYVMIDSEPLYGYARRVRAAIQSLYREADRRGF